MKDAPRSRFNRPSETLPADPPAWVAGYIGLPWREHGRDRSGCDCWGLLRLVLAERFGIAVPAYDGRYADTADRAEIAMLMRGGMGPWRQVDEAGVRQGDGALFRVAGQPCHVGVVVAAGWMLHVQKGVDSGLERHDGTRWARRLAGFYRWAGETA